MNKNIAIRSSSLNEDSIHSSNAGAFESYLNINIENLKLISHSINSVFTEKEVEESFVYSGDIFTSSVGFAIMEVKDFDKILRSIYDEWLRNHASVYLLN